MKEMTPKTARIIKDSIDRIRTAIDSERAYMERDAIFAYIDQNTAGDERCECCGKIPMLLCDCDLGNANTAPEGGSMKLTAEQELKEGEPCGHPGCLNHISHPCEGCGRIGGSYSKMPVCPECGGDKSVSMPNSSPFVKPCPSCYKEDA